MARSGEDRYLDCPDGFFRWTEEKVRIPVYPEGSMIPEWFTVGDLPIAPNPETGRSFRDMWEMQKEILRPALRMENGRFVHRLIVFCWPRGEGKSLIVCLVMLYRFFNFLRQQIVCGANSKDQVQFVHYDIMKNIILHSPELLSEIGRKKGVQQKAISFRDSHGDPQSEIRMISSFSGIVSNINAFTFSEMFKMQKPTFYEELYGSIRNIPNAMGAIDSTVSSKEHVLFRLFESWLDGKVKDLFFSYRCSQNGSPDDYMNPNMTQGQIDSYRGTLILGAFERFFLNLWSAGASHVFDAETVEAIHYLGVNRKVDTHSETIEVITKINKLKQDIKDMEGKGIDISQKSEGLLQQYQNVLWPVESVYRLRTDQNQLQMATIVDLERLSDVYDTNWAILGGLDRDEPDSKRTSARTVQVVLAKGLMGSRGRPMMAIESDFIPEYIYILLYLCIVADSSMEGIKNNFQAVHTVFNGIDTIGSEKFGAYDFSAWAEANDIKLLIWSPSYPVQKLIFSELFVVVKKGRFKAPPVPVEGSKSDDILIEEMEFFDHDPDAKWFGSSEKKQMGGIQDDAMYALGAAIYGGQGISVLDFRERKGKLDFGSFFANEGLMGRY